MKRANTDGSAWEPGGKYAYISSENFTEDESLTHLYNKITPFLFLELYFPPGVQAFPLAFACFDPLISIFRVSSRDVGYKRFDHSFPSYHCSNT